MPFEDPLTGFPRDQLATLPTPLEQAGRLETGASWYIKRDDLTGLGMGGNKARKLEFLCADARRQQSDVLVTVGAAQSNHARMTAAAGARLGLDVHLVLGGDRPSTIEGNQLLSALFGATFHYAGTDDWDELETHMGNLEQRWRDEGRHPYRMPIGGSTRVGARGFLVAWKELLDQCKADGIAPSLVVHPTSSGGTHGGMLAGQALFGGPPILAISVAKQPGDLGATARRLANELLVDIGAAISVPEDAVQVDGDFRGDAYAVPTPAADDAVRFAARAGGWVLDRTYTGKALSGLLAYAQTGRLPAGDVIFWHTGGGPAIFASDGCPELGK